MLKIASFANKDQEVSAHENGEDEQVNAKGGGTFRNSV